MDIAIILSDKNNIFETKRAFGGEDSLTLCKKSLAARCDCVLLVDKSELLDNSVKGLIDKLCKLCAERDAANLIFTQGCCPFMSATLTKELLDTHKHYSADFTQSQGFIAGLAPVVIKCEVLHLLNKLLKTDVYKAAGDASITKDALFNLIALDVNSYEIEDVLSDTDYRLLRLSLDCTCKQNFLSCVRLYEKIISSKQDCFVSPKESETRNDVLHVSGVSGQTRNDKDPSLRSALALKQSNSKNTQVDCFVSGAGEQTRNDVLPISQKESETCNDVLPDGAAESGNSNNDGRDSGNIKSVFDDVALLQETAAKSIDVIRTVPNFYMISSKMDGEKFSSLMDIISGESDTAIIALDTLSAELVKSVFKHDGLKIFIELDSSNLIFNGTNIGESDDVSQQKSLIITSELCESIKKIIDSSAPRRGNEEYFKDLVIVLDMTGILGKKSENSAGDQEPPLYKSPFISGLFALFNEYFPNRVYAQMTRKISNEECLEDFYRYWSDKSGPSGGRVIIKKYSDYCGTLPRENPVDLSPLKRNYCYHLRRDMFINAAGDVANCPFQISNVIGNVFSGDSIQDIFCRADSNSGCDKCDEYYTFNF